MQEEKTPEGRRRSSGSRGGASLQLAFELSKHSPYTIAGDASIHYDLGPSEESGSASPLPFATLPIQQPQTFSLKQLRQLIQHSVTPAIISALSSQGILTPHQAIALTSAQYSFLAPTTAGHHHRHHHHHGAVTEEMEDTSMIAAFLPLLLFRVSSTLTKGESTHLHRASSVSSAKSSVDSQSAAATLPLTTSTPLQHAQTQPGSRRVSASSQAASLSSTPRPSLLSTMHPPLTNLTLFSDQGAGDGIQPQEGDHDHQHAMASYSRASTLPIAATRRRSFDSSAGQMLDNLSILGVGQASASNRHSHGLRVPNHADSYAVDPAFSNAGAAAPSREAGFTSYPASHSTTNHQRRVTVREGEAAPSRSATPSQSSPPDSSLEDVEELSPTNDFPRQSSVYRRAAIPLPSAQRQHSQPVTPATHQRSVQIQEERSPPEPPLSSSLPASLHTFFDYLHKASNSTTPQQEQRTISIPTAAHESLPRRDSHSAAPPSLHRRPSRSQSISISKSGAQRSYNSLDTNQPSLLARKLKSIHQQQVADLQKKEEAEGSFKRAKTSISPQTLAATTPIPTLGTPFSLQRRASLPSDLRRARALPSGPLAFSDMLNEYSQSSMFLFDKLKELPYQIIVTGERVMEAAVQETDDEQKSLEEQKGRTSMDEAKQSMEDAVSLSPSNSSLPKKKKIISNLERLSMRVQPIHPSSNMIDAARRVRVYEDVKDFLLAREDEKRDTHRLRPAAADKDHQSGASLAEDNREPLWIAVEDAPPAVIEIIGSHFGLHLLTIEDCQSVGIREKLEVFTDYLFIVFHALDAVDDKGKEALSRQISGAQASSGGYASTKHLLPLSSSSSNQNSSPSPTSLSSPGAPADRLSNSELDLANSTPVKVIIFPTCVLTFHSSHLTAISKVRRQLEKLYFNRLDNTAWLVHAILDTITDSLIPVVGSSCRQADSLEDHIYMPTDEDPIKKKSLLKLMNLMGRRLAFLRQRMWSKRDILMSLIEKDWAVFLRGVKIPYLRDVYDHVETMLHRIDISIEVVDTIQNTYLSIVNIDVAVAAENTNKAMKKMSAAATIILPLTLVTAIMGMNVTVPWQAAANLGDPNEYPPTASMVAPFIVLMGLFCIFTVGMFYYFKKSDMSDSRHTIFAIG